MKPDAVFNIASMAKPITAAGALKLYEQGKFLLDDPVKQYLPELKDLQVVEKIGTDSIKLVFPKRDIIIRDLFRHTAGFGYVQKIEGARDAIDSLYVTYEVSLSRNSVQFLEKISEVPLKYQPGSKCQYRYSIDVPGFLIERISGKSLHDYFNEELFEPLEMYSTGFYLNERILNKLSGLYTFSEGELYQKDGHSVDLYFDKPPIYSGGGGLQDVSYSGR